MRGICPGRETSCRLRREKTICVVVVPTSTPTERRSRESAIQVIHPIEEADAFPYRVKYHFRYVTSPPNSSESITPTITASTGVLSVCEVNRAEEPSVMRTKSPVPALTVSTATNGSPVMLPAVSVLRTIRSFRPRMDSSLIVEMVEPMTSAICISTPAMGWDCLGKQVYFTITHHCMTSFRGSPVKSTFSTHSPLKPSDVFAIRRRKRFV